VFERTAFAQLGVPISDEEFETKQGTLVGWLVGWLVDAVFFYT